ncbi:hypothetical protein NPIL_215761 [Nephila pilipes]|uniref:Uncharacterized protein n=1 Tax=Nephila pilipes TaxID=299642 RepID=A0A8X6NFB5_NEPPI|nr:hypothetical protein NPIL_215761 [Nephila pilipes]
MGWCNGVLEGKKWILRNLNSSRRSSYSRVMYSSLLLSLAPFSNSSSQLEAGMTGNPQRFSATFATKRAASPLGCFP